VSFPSANIGFFHGLGGEVCGVDLSSEMVRQAQRLDPDISFTQGDMLALTDVVDNSYGGIAAFYAIDNLPRPTVVDALRGIKASATSERSLITDLPHRTRNEASR
jgi:ubiquinone/menaquinone biosynthesis C-methylase UbiE